MSKKVTGMLSKKFSNGFHKNRLDMNVLYDEKKARLAKELKEREHARWLEE